MTDGSGEAWLEVQRQTFTRALDWFAGAQDPAVSSRLERIAAAAGITSEDSVLDAGTGTGALLPHLAASRPARLVALDLTPAMAAIARERYGHLAEVRVGDLATLDEPGAFDVVVCNAMFWNLFDRGAALRAIRRSLRPAGRLLISHPMGATFVRQLRLQDPATLRDDPTDDRGLLAEVAAGGFTCELRIDEPDLYLLRLRLRDDAFDRQHGQVVAE